MWFNQPHEIFRYLTQLPSVVLVWTSPALTSRAVEYTLTLLDFVHVFAGCERYDNSSWSPGFPPSCAAVRFQCFPARLTHIPLLSSSSHSKPVMWAPHSSCHGPSRAPERWCWTWRWSPSTTSSTSEAAPSYVWRYLSQSTRSERPKWTASPQKNRAALICGWCNCLFETAHLFFFVFVFLFLNHHYVILSKDTYDKDSAKISWWESIPVLESPPWFNGHWAFMAAIWTFDTEGCLWCTISDILYLENDLKWELPPLSIRLYTIQFAPVVCEFSSLQISCESDFLYAWIQELSSHRNDAIRSLSCCFFCCFFMSW